MQNINNRDSWGQGKKGRYGNSILLPQLFCKPKTALKYKVCLKSRLSTFFLNFHLSSYLQAFPLFVPLCLPLLIVSVCPDVT